MNVLIFSGMVVSWIRRDLHMVMLPPSVAHLGLVQVILSRTDGALSR